MDLNLNNYKVVFIFKKIEIITTLNINNWYND